MEFEEEDHPRGQPDNTGQFVKKGDEVISLPSAQKVADTIPQKAWKQATPNTSQRVKVGEITNPIYDDMVLSNGRRVKDILTRAVEMPLTGSVGAEHIENHPERKGMVEKYIGVMGEIINDPDYVFEDKAHENTLVIEKKIDSHIVLVVSLNFDNPDYTNTIITMREEDSGRFGLTEKNYEKLGKVLYKKPSI